MNQTIREQQQLLGAMRDRLQGYNVKARRSAGLPKDRPCRFQVHPAGRNTFDVLDRASGKQQGARHGHLEACQFAEQLEKDAELRAAKRAKVKDFAVSMGLWALLFGVVIANLMIFFG